MRKLRLALIFFVAVIFVITALSCGKKKPTEPEEGETVVADEAVVLDETEAESIIEVTDDQIVLPAGTSPDIYQNGKVIVSGISDAAPYGLLRKVESSSTQNGQIVVNTSQARLVDAFDQLDFHTTQSLKTTDIVSSEALTDGVRFVHDSKNPYNYHYIIDEEFNVGNNVTMYVDGELDLTLGYELAAKISLLRGLQYIKAGSFVTSEGDLELNVDGRFNYQRSVELIRHDFAPVVFVVPAAPPVPIVLVPRVTIILNIDAYGEAHVTATVSASASVEAGLEYQKPNWTSYYEKDLGFDYDIPVVDASMNATVDAGPRFEINLYGIAGPWAHARGILNLDADINATPWWTLTGGYMVDAGVHFNVFDYGESATMPNIINHSVVLAQASQNQVATPTFNPPGGGAYTSAQNVTISCATPGAMIYYSIDGSTPSIRYTKPVNIPSTATLKAKATKSGWTDSQIASAVYTINQPQTVATPTFAPPGGTYTSAQNVTISCATPGATIYYSTDGSMPSTRYTSPVNIASTGTLKAKGTKAGWTDSQIASANYTINIQPNTVATPTFNPPGGSYTSAQNVQISCATSGATIRYTTDGSDPSESSTEYTSPITVNSSTTIKAKAFKNGWTPSAISTAEYIISHDDYQECEFPTILLGEWYDDPNNVWNYSIRDIPPYRIRTGNLYYWPQTTHFDGNRYRIFTLQEGTSAEYTFFFENVTETTMDANRSAGNVWEPIGNFTGHHKN